VLLAILGSQGQTMPLMPPYIEGSYAMCGVCVCGEVCLSIYPVMRPGTFAYVKTEDGEAE